MHQQQWHLSSNNPAWLVHSTNAGLLAAGDCRPQSHIRLLFVFFPPRLSEADVALLAAELFCFTAGILRSQPLASVCAQFTSRPPVVWLLSKSLHRLCLKRWHVIERVTTETLVFANTSGYLKKKKKVLKHSKKVEENTNQMKFKKSSVFLLKTSFLLSRLQPWCDPLWLTGLKAPTN